MGKQNRRSVIAGSATLLPGGVLASRGAAGADDTGDQELELDVHADEVTHVDLGNTAVQISVRNCGDEPVSVPIFLEIAHFDEELDVLELDPGESGSVRQSFDPRSLGLGKHEWTVMAGDETVVGALTVEADDGYEGSNEGFHLAVHSWNREDGEAVVHVEDPRETIPIGFDATVVNYHYDAVETELLFEIGDERETIPLELEPRESRYVYTVEELGAGYYEWTATIGEETEIGSIRIVPEDADS
ncbi:hypothetical protein [Natronococcus wangiae]|uniref:hypothetical protein n=1 Tax=Natronococcus wangiae TaxID=3068275 RepID=UPI00273CFBE0|nr:hypothetical protein [Natronococcus sp. AD5]